MLKLVNLRCEHLENPVGVICSPRFSWQLDSPDQAVFQQTRQIQVSTEPSFASQVWDSGEVRCGDTVLVPYTGAALDSDCRYWWRVRASSPAAGASDWSETATFVTAASAWDAPFVSGEKDDSGAGSAETMLRGEFTLGRKVKLAIAHVTALGVYQFHINGNRVSDWAMTPGWTEYASRILYQSHDVTALIKEGINAAGARVGAGWYKGDLAGWTGRRCCYGKETAFAMQLSVLYEDGGREVITTDDNWKASDGPVSYSEIYNGETYDATKEQPDWSDSGFDVSGWRDVHEIKVESRIVVPQDGVPVRPHEHFKPVEIFTAPNGERIVDFGQNLTGWVRLKISGKRGDVVSYSHAEILDKDGNFYTANLRRAKQRIHYTLRGDGEEVYEPLFTFQGFRYIRIDQFPGEAAPDNFTAIAAYSDMNMTGAFECSNPKLNQLMHNIRWSMVDNFFDIPTDCPQRDERIGWTGDAQVFVRAASYLHDTTAFFRKWLRDVAASQFSDGGIPLVVPDILTGYIPTGDVIDGSRAITGWGDAAVICPWTIFQSSGDAGMLEECYPMMKGWVEFMRSRAQWGLIWNTDYHLGDWVALDAKEGSYFGATPIDLIATAYYAYSTELLAKAAQQLGRADDAREYFSLREKIGEAFVKEYFSPYGRLCARTQTSHILALHFGLVPPEFKQRTIDTLVEILGEYDNHLCTGFLGTPYICYALSDNGRLDLAYELLLKEDYPSWLYPLSKGATTIWEHWDGIKPDGSMWSDNMNSFNHYAYGAVGDWMYSVIGGIDTDDSAAGYRRSRIRPRPGGGITSATVSEKTPYGELRSSWRFDGKRLTLEVTVPHNTVATVSLPNGIIADAGGMRFVFAGNGQAAKVPSGTYRFIVDDVELGQENTAGA